MHRFVRRITFALCLTLSPALAVASPRYAVTIYDRAFAPTTLTVPADIRFRLEVRNARTLPSEFESFDLNREKMVPRRHHGERLDRAAQARKVQIFR